MIAKTFPLAKLFRAYGAIFFVRIKVFAIMALPRTTNWEDIGNIYTRTGPATQPAPIGRSRVPADQAEAPCDVFQERALGPQGSRAGRRPGDRPSSGPSGKASGPRRDGGVASPAGWWGLGAEGRERRVGRGKEAGGRDADPGVTAGQPVLRWPGTTIFGLA